MDLISNIEAQVADLNLLIPGLDLQSFMRFTTDPSNTQAVFNLQSAMIKAPNRAEMIGATVASLMANAEIQKLYEERYIPELPTNEKLLGYPEHSLGHKVGEHLQAHGITLDFKGIDLSMIYRKEFNLLSYIGIRGLRIHDILHAVLGLSVSPVDEYAHASFTLAQYRSPFHMMVLASGYIHTAFYEPSEIANFLDKAHRYYELGTRAEFVLSFRFEDHFAMPMTEVRRLLGLSNLLS